MDAGALGALLVSLAFLGALVAAGRGRNPPSYWSISWGLMIATGVLLAIDPPSFLKETARLGASFFPGLQLAGAYQYRRKPVPSWVFAATAILALARSGVSFAGYPEYSHAAVLLLEIGLIGWGGWLVFRRSRTQPESMDWLLAMGAASLCLVEMLDAFYDIGRPDGSVLWAPWLVLGAVVGVLQTLGVSERSHRLAIEERRAQEENERVAQRLESLGILAGGIAHDFNNILTTIVGNTELALMDLDADHPARSSVEDALDGAFAATDLSGQMLAYASGRRLEPQPVDLSELIRARTALLRAAVSPKIDLEIIAPAGLPLVLADPSQIDQVVMNLTVNAGEACTTTGRVRVCVEHVAAEGELPGTHVGRLRAGPHLRLSVEDDGGGIENDASSRIFDPFFTTKFAGRGIGLSVVHRIVEAHDGAIVVRSTTGRTVFEVYLPAGDELEMEKSPPPASAAPMVGRILVVDDEPQVLRVTCSALQAGGHETLTAGGGRDAIALLNDPHTNPSLLLLDATMPEVGAREVIEHVRTTRPALPILMMTGHDTNHLSEQLDAPGIVGWVRKPFRIASLQQRVAESLRTSGRL